MATTERLRIVLTSFTSRYPVACDCPSASSMASPAVCGIGRSAIAALTCMLLFQYARSVSDVDHARHLVTAFTAMKRAVISVLAGLFEFTSVGLSCGQA